MGKEFEPKIEQRKSDHIDLAFKSAVDRSQIDSRFYYEPMLSGHPQNNIFEQIHIGAKKLNYPIWISSMTGGTEKAAHINAQLAQLAKEFGFGMGLGSCRQLLDSDERFADFDVRERIGQQPLYANIGIAQLEEMLNKGTEGQLVTLVEKLRADGLIIHVNPLQEWMQPEGDRYRDAPIDSIRTFLSRVDISVIVKEVGQGIAKQSLKALLQLPLTAVEFGANGGTNFSKLELLRANEMEKAVFANVANLGHSAKQMLDWCNELVYELGEERKCNLIIISGGIKSFLDGFYLVQKSKMPAVYAQASGFLKHALGDYSELRDYARLQIEGLRMANAFLRIKE